jgi:uncharacterized membrane protein
METQNRQKAIKWWLYILTALIMLPPLQGTIYSLTDRIFLLGFITILTPPYVLMVAIVFAIVLFLVFTDFTDTPKTT